MFCFGSCSILSYYSLSKKVQVLSWGNEWCRMMVSQANFVIFAGAKSRILQGFAIWEINHGSEVCELDHIGDKICLM